MSTTSTGSWAGLRLAFAPVAIGFLDEAPEGLPRIERPFPAGCAYWKHASEGHAFYTTAEDHYHCPVGAFTHGVELPPSGRQELQSLVGTMIELKYLTREEVAAIPHRARAMRIAAYAPLPLASFAPDVVVVRGNARQMMLVAEAARAAGVFDGGNTMGRPACAMLPQVIDGGSGVASLACIGNRVYNALDDNEMYCSLPGTRIGVVADELATILSANAALEEFHRRRAAG